MTGAEFEALTSGDSVYRYDTEIRSYKVDRKTNAFITLDRSCTLGSAMISPGAGTRLSRKKVVDYFEVSRLKAVQAEYARIQELVAYHRKGNRQALAAMKNIIALERAEKGRVGDETNL